MSLQDFLPLLSIILTLCAVVGGFFAFKKGYSQEAGAIQERVIEALKDEVKALKSKIESLETERSTQDRVLSTIRYALKQYGMRIVISGDFVTVRDASGKNKTTRIQALPVPSQALDDDEDAI